MASTDTKQTHYLEVHSPHGGDDTASAHSDSTPSLTASSESNAIAVRTALYASIGLVLLQPMQFGWSIPQLNLSTFHNTDDCDARPVAPGTCLMFPGHSSSEWTWVVNAWVLGGMLGSLGSGRFADMFGRKRVLMANGLMMILGALVQATAQGIPAMAIGRFLAGIASGVSTTVPNGYINEISPPHLRSRLGVTFQIAVGVGIVVVGCTFFFANTSSGWRYIAGFPAVLGGLFVVLATQIMIESPTWLLAQGRRDEAEAALTRVYGEENVMTALKWMGSTAETSESAVETGSTTPEAATHTSTTSPWATMFSARYRHMVLVATAVALSQQLSGINAVFFYSSSIFQDAGLDDDRIGSIVVHVVFLVPAFFVGALGARFGNRRMMVFGHMAMLVCAVGITISLVTKIAVLSIIFTAAYVAAFAFSLGPLVFPIAAALFPDHLRASGMSVCFFANWCGTLVVGIAFPYVADALGDWSFLPFMITLAIFGAILTKWLPETYDKTSDEIQAVFFQRYEAQQSKQ